MPGVILYYLLFIKGEDGGGGSKYYIHYKMTHLDCILQDISFHVLFEHLSGLFIPVIVHFYIHVLNKLIFVVGKEMGRGVDIMVNIKWLPLTNIYLAQPKQNEV